MNTNHASPVGAVGVVTLTGARVPGDMRELPFHVGELSPLGPGVTPQLDLTGDQSVYTQCPTAHRLVRWLSG